jgi:hypothetical protein
MVRLTNVVSHRKNKNQHNETRFCPPNRGRLIADGVSLRVPFETPINEAKPTPRSDRQDTELR